MHAVPANGAIASDRALAPPTPLPLLDKTPLTALERDGLRDLARLFRLASSLLDEAVATGRADFAIGAASKGASAGVIAAKVGALISSGRSSLGESV